SVPTKPEMSSASGVVHRRHTVVSTPAPTLAPAAMCTVSASNVDSHATLGLPPPPPLPPEVPVGESGDEEHAARAATSSTIDVKRMLHPYAGQGRAANATRARARPRRGPGRARSPLDPAPPRRP